MDDSVERTLCQLPSVHVFRIPTRTSADGYRAADWPKDPSWSGKMKVVEKGQKLSVVLMDAQNNTFAICHVNDESCVERTLDSGRYFVLKITNAQGRHAFIGIAFNERSDAFDFNIALSTFRTEQEREQKATNVAAVEHHAAQDFSLKSGEKIKIKLNTKKAAAPADEHEAAHAPAQSFGADPFGADPFGSDIFGSDPFASGKTSDPFGYSDPFGSR